ncbi:chromate efflux transporter [Amphibacillus cookii]|uniref:chromate efflux transporter n=1 Tax=Amphibacillus cookii TaxID=767787 RepID=UPI00195D83A5|nr:chromate efflux transporter [Amphibacillus cookii]MBM7541996.1 chromate transporter [Amphibacillus cookii]
MKVLKPNKGESTSWRSFLWDIFICSLGAFGGPEAHYGIFTDQLVTKKQYLSEEELVELIALCSILPGPSSTQTIVAVGHKKGGPLLALLTMLVWSLPVLTLMTLFSFLYAFLDRMQFSQDGLRYIGPMAVGFIMVAALRIGKKVISDRITVSLLIFGAVTTFFFRQAWVFPFVLIIGGLVTVLTSKQKKIWYRVKLNPPWIYFFAFIIIAVGSIVLAIFTNSTLLSIFESFYRYGYLVFGGGQVVIPFMFSDLVEINGFMRADEFLTGYGLVQGMPGPMFSFSAYAGGLAGQGAPLYQIASAIAAGIGIFLPGLLLIYFVYPVWENLKKIQGIKVSLKGVNAVAGGLIAASALIIMQSNGFAIDNVIIMMITILALYTKKVPAPLLVLGVILVGFLF